MAFKRINPLSLNGKYRKQRKLRFLPMVAVLVLCGFVAISQDLNLKYNGNQVSLLQTRLRNLLYFMNPQAVIVPKKAADGTDEVLDIAVMVMGEAAAFKDWYNKFRKIDKETTNLVFMYASFDAEVSNTNELPKEKKDGLENDDFLEFDTLFINGTQWTEGRNLLAAEALRKEKIRGKKFDYWYFLDDDIEPVCISGTDIIMGEGASCWQKVFNFLGSSSVPEKASTVMIADISKDGFAATSNGNGHNAAFKRTHVPYLLPYAKLEPGASEWISQAANMCVVGSCMPNTIVFTPLIYAKNGKHRDYNKEGYDAAHIHKTITENYHDVATGFTPCDEWNAIKFFQEGEHASDPSKVLGPFKSSEELNDEMSYSNFDYCQPLKRRFEEWEETVLSESNAETKKLIEKKEEEKTAKMDIAVLVMGEASAFDGWLETLREINDVSISYVFASYDTEVEQNKNEEEEKKDSFYYSDIYIDHKTWTEGRNELAKEAFRLEKSRGKEFDYWLFLDDDVLPVCQAKADELMGEGSCWQKIFNFMSSDLVPGGTTTVSLPWFPKEGFAATSNTDALFAAFKRHAVPYLIPYATLLPGSSEWVSQAANFCVMGSCFENSNIYIPFITAKNAKSRPYVRTGFTIESVHGTVTRNFHVIEKDFTPCHDWTSITDYYQGEHKNGVIGPFRTSEDLTQYIPAPKYEYCSPFVDRFNKWAEEIEVTNKAETATS